MNSPGGKTFKIRRKLKHRQLFIFPTIVIFPEEDYGAVSSIKGYMICWLHWTWQFGQGTFSAEYAIKPIDVGGYVQWFNTAYTGKRVDRKIVDEILNDNKDMRKFLEHAGLEFYYPKILLAKEIQKRL